MFAFVLISLYLKTTDCQKKVIHAIIYNNTIFGELLLSFLFLLGGNYFHCNQKNFQIYWSLGCHYILVVDIIRNHFYIPKNPGNQTQYSLFCPKKL